MPRWSDHHQLITVNIHRLQALVIHWSGDHAKVHAVIDHRFQNLGTLQAADIHAHAGVQPFELGKDLRQDMQTGGLVGAYHDFSPGYAVHLAQGGNDVFAGLQGSFSIFLEGLARDRKRHLAAAAVKEARANLLLQGAYLR